MNEAIHSNISRIVVILLAILLYGVALISVFRRSKKTVIKTSDDAENPNSIYDGPERRLYPRVKLGVDIKYKLCVDNKCELTVFKEGIAKDVSEGGILLETSEELARGSMIELKLKLPISLQYMLITGRIVWTKGRETKKMGHHGISFMEINSNDKKIIAQYITEARSKTEENK